MASKATGLTLRLCASVVKKSVDPHTLAFPARQHPGQPT